MKYSLYGAEMLTVESFAYDFFIQDSNIEIAWNKKHSWSSTTAVKHLFNSYFTEVRYALSTNFSVTLSPYNCFVLGNKEPSYIIFLNRKTLKKVWIVIIVEYFNLFQIFHWQNLWEKPDP